jgi:hypothetical protein
VSEFLIDYIKYYEWNDTVFMENDAVLKYNFSLTRDTTQTLHSKFNETFTIKSTIKMIKNDTSYSGYHQG